MSTSEELQQKLDTRRNELLVGISEQGNQIRERIAKNRSLAMDHVSKSKEHEKQYREKEAGEEMRKASQLAATIRADEALLRGLENDMEMVRGGRHPDMTSLQACISGVSNAERQAELSEARAAFDALLTPELKDAAHRLVNASRTTNQQALDLGQLLLS